MARGRFGHPAGYPSRVTTPLAPGFLVALDPILDPNFARTVVLMLHHDPEQGAFGLVLNRATDFPMSELCKTLELGWHGDHRATVDWGGPVQPDQGWVVFRDPLIGATDSERVFGDISWSGSREALRDVTENPDSAARIFLGYAGWGAGQVEDEIADGAWLVVPMSDDRAGALVFDTTRDELWTAAVRSLGIEPATLVSTQGVN